MSAATPTEARKEVQRAIGRNLLNFQRVELLLKHLLGGSAVRGEISDLPAALEKRRTKISSQMLGLLAGRLFEELLFSHSAPPPEILPDRKRSLSGKEAAFATTFTIGDEHHAEWKGRLEKLIKDRNRLVHGFLLDFPPDSLDTPDGCQKALAALDAQQERIRHELDELKWLFENLHDFHAKLHEEMKDPQFRQKFSGSTGDQSPT